MKNSLLAILTATAITIVVAGPLLVLLWFSWRAVLVGILSVSAVFLFYASVLAAGGAMYNPGSGNPVGVVFWGWAVAAVCAFAAFWLAGRGIGVKLLTVFISYIVIVWTLVLRDYLEMAWFIARNPDELQTWIAEIRAEPKRPRGKLVLRDGVGRDIRISHGSDTYILYLEPGTDSANRILALLADPDLVPYVKGRHWLTTVVERPGADAMQPRAWTPSPKHRLSVEQVPSFYDPKDNAFRLNAYEWMIQNIGVPAEAAQKIYLRYFDKLPPSP